MLEIQTKTCWLRKNVTFFYKFFSLGRFAFVVSCFHFSNIVSNFSVIKSQQFSWVLVNFAPSILCLVTPFFMRLKYRLSSTNWLFLPIFPLEYPRTPIHRSYGYCDNNYCINTQLTCANWQDWRDNYFSIWSKSDGSFTRPAHCGCHKYYGKKTSCSFWRFRRSIQRYLWC